jgi:hypothetical protein
MKRTYFKFTLRTLVAMFFLLGGMFFANRAEAQSYNWLNESEAVNKLNTEIDQLALDIQNFVPGSTPYKNMANQIHYYKLIMLELEGGLNTESSASTALPKVNNQFGSENQMLSKTALTNLYNGAVVLLTE